MEGEVKTPDKGEKTQLIAKDDDGCIDEGKCSCCCLFPKSVYFIIATEFCERFCYYGMRTILIIYLTQHLSMRKDDATALYHFYVCLCYFTPLLGAFIADNYLGKYWTILMLSIIYAIGNSIMSFTAMAPPNLAGPLVGLFLIGVGTGGIKPCVSSLGGDQIPPGKERILDSFFSIFYFSINAGSLLSTFTTPLMRADVQCFGGDCYPLAFGVPALLMVAAIVLFICGSKLYVNIPAEGNVLGKSFRCVVHAWANYFKHRKSDPKPNLLDYAADQYDEDFINDIRSVSRVLVLFLPLPIFWSLYDQQGSRWTLQATKLDGYITNGWILHPDQMVTCNTLLILFLIPLFESVIYPILTKLKIPNSPLQRMTAGLLLVAGSFLIAFFLQLKIEALEPQPIAKDYTRVRLVSLDPCAVHMKAGALNFTTSSFNVTHTVDMGSGVQNIQIQIEKCKAWPGASEASFTKSVTLGSGKAQSLYVWRNPSTFAGEFLSLDEPDQKDKRGKPKMRVVGLDAEGGKLSLVNYGESVFDLDIVPGNGTKQAGVVVTDYAITKQGFFSAVFSKSAPKSNMSKISLGPINVTAGQVFSLVIFKNPTVAKSELAWTVMEVVELRGAVLSILLQLPQYLVITVAEILFSITGLAFAYSQAPVTMKSLLSAVWLMNVAVGNVVVMIVAEVNLLKQSFEFLIFVFLCLLTTVIFAILACFYKYVETPPYQVMQLSSPGEKGGPEEKIE